MSMTKPGFWALVRDEPYRLLFPLAILSGMSGAFHWIFFALGLGKWNVPLHVQLQVPAYVGLFAGGFLTTAVPRFTGTPSTTRSELTVLLALAGAVMLAPTFQNWHLVAGCFLAYLGFLTVFLVKRHRRSASPPPGVLPWVYAAFAMAAVGALLIWDSPGRAIPWMTQGFVFGLILATAPLVGHRILEHKAAPSRRAPPVLALVIAASLAMESWGSGSWVIPVAYGIRGAILVGVLWWTGLARPPGSRVPHAVMFWVSLLLAVSGPMAAALFPLHRAGMLHLTFIGGFTLMILMVGTRVVLMHGGRREVIATPYLPATVYGGLVLSAVALRVVAEFAGPAYGVLLGLAATAWIVAHIIFLAGPGRVLYRT